MPDSSGKIRGITVPSVPWHRFSNDCIHEPNVRDCPFGCDGRERTCAECDQGVSSCTCPPETD